MRYYPTERQAAVAASRACGHLAIGEGERIGDALWRPVVVLRPDQTWMRERVAERGVVVRVAEETSQ